MGWELLVIFTSRPLLAGKKIRYSLRRTLNEKSQRRHLCKVKYFSLKVTNRTHHAHMAVFLAVFDTRVRFTSAWHQRLPPSLVPEGDQMWWSNKTDRQTEQIQPTAWCRLHQYLRREENQLDATECFIVIIICSTCFGHSYAHHQELETILVLLPHTICGNNTIFYGTRHLSLFWARLIQSMPPHSTYGISIVILSSHPRLGLPNGLFTSGLPTKTLYTRLLLPIRSTCPARLIID